MLVCYMFNMDKITRTKLAMLVTVVLLTIFTTIGLYYTMTVSNVTNLGGSDPVVLNFSMVLAIMIAFMWMIILILFYEFKTDDALKTELHKLEKAASDLKARSVELEERSAQLEEFEATLKATTFRPAVIDQDVIYAGVPEESRPKAEPVSEPVSNVVEPGVEESPN